MGKNNRQRRKQKVRSKGGGNRGRRVAPKSGPQERSVQELVQGIAADASGHRVPRIVTVLASRRPSEVADAFEGAFRLFLPVLWESGWLPGEVIRYVKRQHSAHHGDLVSAAIAVDHAGRPSETLHAAWRDHIAELGLPAARAGWLVKVARADPGGWPSLLSDCAETFRSVARSPMLEETIPPPGSKQAKAESVLAERAPSSDSVLEKVRNLLAKAESTSFDAEAEMFTAKAHELMARHAIDEAVVWANAGDDRAKPTHRRIALEEPYADSKAVLLSQVCLAFSCRSLYLKELAAASVVGFESDLLAAETLYTSLLVQAQQALSRAAASAPPGAKTRSRSYRAAFLNSYAARIGERLDEINSTVREAEAEASGGDFLPVLASRSLAVEEETDRLFANTGTFRPGGGWDAAGSAAGRQAADQAELAKAVDG